MRLVAAADGGLARVRLPGGLVDATGLRALASAARDLGDGRLELTSRGNVQLRALAAGDDVSTELGGRLAEAGLWPSLSHELVRNIVASPLADLAGLVRALDAAICADPRLAELSGRFLFGLDDGSGDIAALAPDVLAMDGLVEGLPAEDVVAAMIAAAHAFLDERAAQGSSAWRVAELTDGRARLRARLDAPAAWTAPPAPPAPAGEIAGRQVLLARLGRLTADQADWLADHVGDGTAVITPWRSVVVPAVDPAGAAAAGFGVDAGSPWYGVSACAGQPGCAKALADVQSEAARTGPGWHRQGLSVHFSGCARRCGRPVDTVVDVVATEDGYVITGA
ncbi:MAG: precorrin-3B synthase [Jatrophihabitans sp.]|nr:precorrin-3B synthase [Jatrophihabitans sp.]